MNSFVLRLAALFGVLLSITAIGYTATTTSPPKTPSGWVYPSGKALTNDGNWLTCGADYFTGLRHIGTDIPATLGATVYSIGEGRVAAISPNGWGDGNCAVLVRHLGERGEFIAVYGHIKSTLTVGNYIRIGDSVGTVGKWDGGNHLHFGIHPGKAVPSGSLGRLSDSDCSKPTETNGFVAPISYIRVVRPVAGPIK